MNKIIKLLQADLEFSIFFNVTKNRRFVIIIVSRHFPALPNHNKMVCLSETGQKLPINVDFKEEGSRTLIGVFVTAFVHYFLRRFIFTVRKKE